MDRLSDIQKEIILALAENNMRSTFVAEKLNYHRNTVEYHILQVIKKTGLNPKNFYDLCKLVEAVKNNDYSSIYTEAVYANE